VTYLEDLTTLTLAVYDLYARGVVERFNFCPWARSAREGGQVTLRVISSEKRDDFSESLTALEALHRASSPTEIALFIYPLLDLDRLGFEDHVRQLRALAESAAEPLSDYAMAAFHPAAAADLRHPDRLVPFVRRTPDPTLQLVRKSTISGIKGLVQGTQFLDVSELSLDAIRAFSAAPTKPLRDRIAEQNLATVERLGTSAIEAVYDDIAREREAGHERLLQRHGRRGPRRF
jgi:hypothetical protein